MKLILYKTNIFLSKVISFAKWLKTLTVNIFQISIKEIMSSPKRVISFFVFTKENVLERVVVLLRINIFIFLSYLCYTYIISTIEFMQGLRETEYLDFTVGDMVWFLSNKIVLLLLFYGYYLIVKFKIENEALTIELHGVIWFCLVRVIWQILEIIYAPLADNWMVMWWLTACSFVALPYLSLYRFFIYQEDKFYSKIE